MPLVLTEEKEILVNFEKVLTEAIDEVFTALGESVKQTIYSYLKNKLCIKKEQIPSKIESFTNAIESIFGDAAKLIELKIIEKIHHKVKRFTYKTCRKEMFFAEYLDALQKYLS